MALTTVKNAGLAGSIDLTAKVTGALPVANGGTALTSGFANGVTAASQWRLTTDFTNDAVPIASNLEAVDTDGFGVILSVNEVSAKVELVVASTVPFTTLTTCKTLPGA